ncbi:hypothetical protein B0H14DRAFT_2612600 [Mycena olivaceomarginata]|nr:hypothetical protein B0H14DRAFT_2612600 [Mycena olivaceomarginata]
MAVGRHRIDTLWFDGGCVAAIAAVLLRFARALGRAMASEHVPDPSKNRQPLDSGFEFATKGIDFQLIVESPMSEFYIFIRLPSDTMSGRYLFGKMFNSPPFVLITCRPRSQVTKLRSLAVAQIFANNESPGLFLEVLSIF